MEENTYTDGTESGEIVYAAPIRENEREDSRCSNTQDLVETDVHYMDNTQELNAYVNNVMDRLGAEQTPRYEFDRTTRQA